MIENDSRKDFLKFIRENYKNILETKKKKKKKSKINFISKNSDNKKEKSRYDKELKRLMFLSGIYAPLQGDGSFQSILSADAFPVSEERGEEMKYDYRFKREKKKSEVIDAYNFNGGLSTEIRRAGPGDNPLYNNLNDKFKKK